MADLQSPDARSIAASLGIDLDKATPDEQDAVATALAERSAHQQVADRLDDDRADMPTYTGGDALATSADVKSRLDSPVDRASMPAYLGGQGPTDERAPTMPSPPKALAPTASSAPAFVETPHAEHGAEAPIRPDMPDVARTGGTISTTFITDLPKLKQSTFAGKAPTTPEPETTIDYQGQQIRPSTLMDTAQLQLRDEVNGLTDEYRTERDAMKRKEIWEGIVHGIGLMAAGYYGMKHGIDMSGTKFNPTDWVAQQASLRANYDALRGATKEKFAAQSESFQALQHELDRRNADIDRKWSQNHQLYEDAARAHNEANENARQQWQADVKSIDLRNHLVEFNATLGAREDAIQARIHNAKTLDEAKAVALDARRLQEARRLAPRYINAIGQATGAKDSDHAMVMVSQADDINQQIKDLGMPGFPDEITKDPRGGNGFFERLTGTGADKPGMRKPSSAADKLQEFQATGKQAAVPAATATPAAATGRVVPASMVNDYASKHGMSPDAARQFLTGQGYTIGQ